MDKNEPIETRKTLKISGRKDLYRAIIEFQKLVMELGEQELWPCEIKVEVMFIRGGCPHA